METGMSQQELHRVEVVALRRSGHISQAEAARRLRLTTRQVRRQHFDGTAELCWRNASLPFTAVERPRRAPAELTRQEVTWPRKWRSISTPRANHPWKTTPIGPRSPEFVNRG